MNNLAIILSIHTKKTTKIKAFESLINFVNDHSDALTALELRTIYSALKTVYPRTVARDISDYWKLLIKTSGKKDVRSYLNGIYVKTDRQLVSSSGATLCIVDLKKEHDLIVGSLYEAQNEKVISIGKADLRYPDFNKCISGGKIDITDSFDLEAIHNGYDDSINGVQCSKIGEHYFMNEFLKYIPANYANAALYEGNAGDYCNLCAEIETEEASIKLIITHIRIQNKTSTQSGLSDET